MAQTQLFYSTLTDLSVWACILSLMYITWIIKMTENLKRFFIWKHKTKKWAFSCSIDRVEYRRSWGIGNPSDRFICFFFLRWQSRRVSPLCRLRKVLKIFGLIFWNVLKCTKQDVQSNTMVFYYDIEFTKRKLSWKNIFRSILK